MAGPVAENILAGVWQLQMYGCGEPPGQGAGLGAGLEAGLVTLRLGGATPTLLQLPGRVRRVVAVPSLLELAARRVYSGLLTPGLSLQMRVTEEVHLYIPSLLDSLQNSLYSAQHEDSGLQLASLAPLLPASLLQLLARGPATFCCRPACRGPIFSEVCRENIFSRSNIFSLSSDDNICQACVQLLAVQVQRSWIGGGRVERRSFVASSFYCR